MAGLPQEVLEEILQYLKPSDRLVAAVTCRSWFEASLAHHLWKDVVVNIRSVEDAAKMFLRTRRPIQHIKIKDVDFSSSCSEVNGFWEHVSPGLVSLEFHQSFMSEASLLSILLPCSSLKSLHFHDCRDTFITGKLFSNPLVLNHLRKALPQLAELCFADNCAYLSDALVDRFISLISVSPLCSLVMAGTSISFHPGVHKRFYPESAKTDECQGSKSSELVLTFDCLLGHITHHSASIRQLDFSRTLINDKACLALSQVTDLKLSSLFLRSCEVSSTGISALCSSQPTLVELDVSACVRLTDSALNSICSGLPNLRKLSLQSCRALTDTGLASLSQLVELNDVNLQGLERITRLGVEQGLLSRPNRALRKLNLGATRIDDKILHHLATNAPKLTHLDLTSCVTAVSDSSLAVLWRSLRQLRQLRLDWCLALTDAAFFQTETDCIAVGLPGLVYLSVNGCNKITDKSLQQAFRFRELRHLNLSSCSLITDAGLEALSQHNRGLEVLNLNYCNKISDNGMTACTHWMARLTRLELHGCIKLTSRTLAAIENRPLRYLSYLNVSHCTSLSLDQVDQMQLRMTSLREINTSGLE